VNKMISDVVACCICGVVHSGTTILMKTLRAHPDLCAPTEGHILRLNSMAEFKAVQKRRAVIRSGWHINKEQLKEAMEQKNIEMLYRYLRRVSPTIVAGDKKKKIIDKTPSYIYRLREAMDRSENIPFIAIKKDPRNFYYSLNRRNMEWKKIRELYRHSYEVCVPDCKRVFGKRLMVVSWERFMLRPIKTMMQICSHVDVEFDKNLYTSEFFKRRLKPQLRESYKKVSPGEIRRVEKTFKKHCLD